MTEQEQINELKQQLDALTKMVNANEYSNLSVFLKQVLMKSSLTVNGNATIVGLLTQTGVTPIADGTKTFNKTSNTTIAITTKNGVVTAIVIS